MSLAALLDMRPVALEVFWTLLPAAILAALFQILILRRPAPFARNLAVSGLYLFAGLTLFLHGVNIGFIPVGERLGFRLASLGRPWLILPIGFGLGLAATFGEPSVRILGRQVETASSGAIPGRVIVWSMALGVGVAMAFGLWRIVAGFPLDLVLVPGYLLAIGLIRVADPTFMAIAFDSSTVATGPLVGAFVMALALGLADGLEGASPMQDGFGLIALVGLATLLIMLAIGALVARTRRRS